MERHWSSYCAMSIVQFMAFPELAAGDGPAADRVARIAADDFFDAVEVGWVNNPMARQAVRNVAESGRLAVGFGAHPAILSQKLDVNSVDEPTRQHAVAELKGLMHQACEMGAARFVMLSGPYPGPEREAQARDALLRSLLELCGYGRGLGLGVTLETFDRAIDKKCLVGPAEEAAAISAAVRETYPDFGLLYDLSHMPLLKETPAAMAILGDHLVHVHVGNCVLVDGRPAYGDKHPGFGFQGGVNGVQELAEFIRGMFAAGYLGEGKWPRPWVGFEVKPQAPGETSELTIANAKRTWRQAWALA